MSWNQIAGRWRSSLVKKLQEGYGLSETEANRKVESWLDWLQAQPSTLAAERSEADPARRAPSPAPSKSKSKSAIDR